MQSDSYSQTVPQITASNTTDRLDVWGKIVWFPAYLEQQIHSILARANSFDDFCLGCNTHRWNVLYNGGNQTYSIQPQ
jgi:hypothetical protein